MVVVPREGDRRARGALRCLADQDAARVGGRLKTRGRVDEIAGDQPLAGRPGGDRGLTGHHGCPSLERQVVVGRQSADRFDQVQSGPDGSLGVVFVGLGAPQTAMTASPMYFSSVPP